MSAHVQRHESRLAAEDAARLHMSVEENPMLITAVMALDRPIGHEELEARLGSRLVHHAPFRQRVIEPRLGLGMPRWSDDPTFDVRHHVHRIDPTLLPSVPPLDALVSNCASMPLGDRHPLWRVHLIDGPAPAVVILVHHALADGSALLALLGELADEHGAAPCPTSRVSAPLRSRVRRIAAGATAAGRLALRPADPETILTRRKLTGDKHLAYSAKLSLHRLRDAAHILGTTVTGLLLIGVTGALRSILGTSAASSAGVLHALVPVDTRAGSRTLGNRFGSVLVPLPVGTEDLATRIRELREATRTLGFRTAGVEAARLAAAAGAMSAMIERLGVEMFSRKASITVSSVRGPTRELHLCGACVRDVMVWAPASGSISISVTLMSYAGGVRLGIAADAHVIDDIRLIVRELELELERVCSFARTNRT